MGKINYLTPKGDDFLISLKFFQADGVTQLNIIGSSITLILKTDKNLADNDGSNLTFTGVIDNGTFGLAHIAIPHASSNLQETFYYKIIFADSTAKIYTFAYGVITFTIAGSSGAAYSQNNLSILLTNSGSGGSSMVIFQQDQFTASASQTVFTFTYTAQGNTINVYKNGVKMQKGAGKDYQEAIDLGSITFNTGVDLNDEIEVDYAVA